MSLRPFFLEGKGREGKGKEERVVDMVEDVDANHLRSHDSLDTAVEHDARNANGYELLHHLIRGGCKAAIYVSERV